MKTLVIHPLDSSTDFLKPIYKGMHNKTVVNGGITRDELIELIKSHDRIIMMGHGWTSGLFNTYKAQFKTSGLVIDFSMVQYLREKICVFIWCKAHVFVETTKLKGFNTDMFISEVGEALWFDIETNQEVVDESNNGFVEIYKRYRTKDNATAYRRVRKHYAKIAEKNEVASFNYDRLYLNE